MVGCVAYGCTNRSDKRKSNETFHRFPKDSEMRQKWVKAVRRKNWKPTTYSSLCSEHFREEDLDRTSVSTVRVKENAVPSIFPAFPSYLQKTVKTRKPPTKRKCVEEDENVSGSRTSDSSMFTGEVTLKNNDSLPLANDKGIEVECLCASRDMEDESPRKKVLRLQLRDARNIIINQVKKLKTLKQKSRRMIKRNIELSNMIETLKKKHLLSEECCSIFEMIGKTSSNLLERQINKVSGNKKSGKYPSELRSFALSLHFFSPKAYSFVRKQFNCCLPHPRTISSWYKSVDGAPGFHEEAMGALKAQALKVQAPLLCALMIDEIAIRQQIEWDGRKHYGYVDFGSDLRNDAVPVAKQVLTFLVVCVNQYWKLPVGYFLIDGMSGEQKCSLVKQCLKLLHTTGIVVGSLTFDGASANMSMAKHLGCLLESENLKTHFPHPITGEDVHIFLDPCHMLKLIRNTLGEKGVIFDNDNNKIEWRYIKQLHELQVKEGLVLGNKLRAAHIDWRQQKMKVKLAAQIFSRSVADAIEYCQKKQVKGFEHAEGTILFIKTINDLFDVLNSRSSLAPGKKSALNPDNFNEMRDFLIMTDRYLLTLKEKENGTVMCESNRQMAFLGFRICIQSAIKMYDDFVGFQKPLRFLPFYKICQDHLELFFGAIRMQGGCNDNPTAKQFQSAYKKLLIHYELHENSRGNCITFKESKILTCSSARHSATDVINETTSKALMMISSGDMVRSDLDGGGNGHNSEDDLEFPRDHDYVCVTGINCWSEFTDDIIAYIAGFVVRHLEKKILCEACINSLRDANTYPTLITLIGVKNRGGLIFPSQDVLIVCKEAEKLLRRTLTLYGDRFFSHPGKLHKLISKLCSTFIETSIFESLKPHALEQSPLDNHIFYLIKAISSKYLNIRLYHQSKIITQNLHKLKVRQKLSKLVQFKGQ